MKYEGKRKKIVSLIIVCVVKLNLFAPAYSYSDTSNLIDINFGELLTLQEENGYASFEGENMLENFYQAKAELPAEIPVLSSFPVSGENIFYVSVNGDDNADGSENSPLATVTEALDRISELSASERAGGSVIYIRGGEYHLTDTINITSEHTCDNSTLFIAAYPDERVSLTANESVSLLLAKKVTLDNTDLLTYSCINNNAVGKLYYISYENMGFSKIPYESTFYMNDIPMYVSRYPNEGTDTINSVIRDGSYIDNEGFIRTGLPMEWRSQDEHPFTWMDTHNIHIFGRVANEWSLTDGIVWFDDNNKTVKTTSEITPNYSPVTTNFWNSIPSTYYYANIFEEIDTFGEWFADDQAQRFYFYLPEDIDINSSVINYKKHEGYAIDISEGNNIVIDNIDISYVDRGINITQSNNVVLQNSRINNTQSTAVKMYNTEKCGVLNSDIQNVKNSHAVIITQSAENVAELVPRRNFIQNSCINNVSKALNVVGSNGNIFSHNLIENTSCSAVNLNGAENIFEYNEFSTAANKITDAGGIYVGGDIKNRANTIRYNYFHDSKPGKKNARAIYNDDCSDMNWNYGNVIKNFSYGIFLHSGDDHVIMDNIVINTGTYIRNSADYATQESLMKNYFFKDSPQFISGYISNNLGSSETWQTRYSGILKEKYDQVLEAKAGVDKDTADIYDKIINVITKKNAASDYDNAEDIKKACDLVADTGCYYIRNTYVVPGSGYSNGYGSSSYGLYNVCEPDNGGKPEVIYVSADESGNDYDISEYVKNMGLLNSSVREKDRPVIYMEQKKEFVKDEFTGVSWSRVANCSYYMAEIATDAGFKNIVISYDTADNEYPVYSYAYYKDNGINLKNKTSDYEFLTDTPYYVRVKAVSLANCVTSDSVISDTVEFILRESLENLKTDKTVVKSYFGKTSMKIKIEGKIPEYLLNERDRQITVVLYENGNDANLTESIRHIAQINAAYDGSFSYVFSEDVTDKTRIKVRAGINDITDEIFCNAASNVIEISFTMHEEELSVEKAVTAAARINNMLGVTDKFTIVVAAYGENGRLVGCKKINSSDIYIGEIVEMSNEYMLPVGTAEVKAFLWNIPDMKPIADTLN